MSGPRIPTPAFEEARAAHFVALLARGCRKTQRALDGLGVLWSPRLLHFCFRPEYSHVHQVIPTEQDVTVVGAYAADEHPGIRRAAVLALGWVCWSESARRALLTAAADKRPEIRRMAIRALADAASNPILRADLHAALRLALADPWYSTRWEAARGLAGSPYVEEARAALIGAPPRGELAAQEWGRAAAALGMA